LILHIVVDDKFIDIAYRIFEEVYPRQNVFIFISKSNTFKYIKKTPCQTIHPLELLSRKFIKTLQKYDMVVFHSLNYLKMQILVRADPSIKFVWMGWGWDYYRYIVNHPDDLLLPQTLLIKRQERKKMSYFSIAREIKQLINHLLFKKVTAVAAINRINFFAPVLKEDYELVKRSIPDFKPQYIAWNYGCLEDDVIRGFKNQVITGNNILIGNSAKYTNNHLDAFELLLKIEIGNRYIIVPLSYGDPCYRDVIINNGKKRWSDKFLPLVDFMPIDEYVKLISSCSVVIMNHLRQQAGGNIVIAMYLGAKVFLQQSNSFYSFFKKEGAYIFSIDDLARDQNIVHGLTPAEIKINRAVLQKHWSRNAIHDKTKNLIETVLNTQK